MRRPPFLLPCLTALLAEPALAGGDVRVTEGIVGFLTRNAAADQTAEERLPAFARTALR